MPARQTYRTMSRMQRRRSYVEDKLGVREDFSSPQDQPAAQATEPAPSPAASEPDYVSELERLAQLRDQGIITDEAVLAAGGVAIHRGVPSVRFFICSRPA